MRREFEFFTDEQRLDILKAAQAGQYEKITTLLNLNSKLIDAKTKTKGQSLLHVAALHGYEHLCELLLSKGHTPNPVDFEGYTPFQKTKSVSIQAMLIEAHSRNLFKHTIFDDQSQNIGCQVLDKENFFDLISMISEEEMDLSLTFAVTASRITESNDNLSIQTYFRSEGLMVPYFGELLVAHEEEQVRTSRLASLTQMDRDEREIRAYANGILTVLDRYPELVGLPQPTDLPHVSHAKKLIIVSGIIGFASYVQQFSENNTFKFQELLLNNRNVREANGIASVILNGENLKLVRVLRKEIQTIYGASSSTLSAMTKIN